MKVFGINGPVVEVENASALSMAEMVYVGEKRLIGEVIRLKKNFAVIQVFEDTTGLRPGEIVEGSKRPLSVTLGPGIISNIFDGIQRPLETIQKKTGIFIDKGIGTDNLDPEKKWAVKILVKAGGEVTGGEIFAEIPETSLIIHKSMIPPDVSGTVRKAAKDGKYNITETLLEVEDSKGIIHKISLSQKWPVRTPRPVKTLHSVNRPLITGQRIIDTLFPIAKGGMAALPGGFGTGKTMTQHQFAKWSDADLIIYIGCGERGNEMTQVLEEFAELKDPKSGKSLMDRTVLIANTSNMPVAAREASIYTGITMAEYYRDMGYHVAIMADSTSRWAEALRELSGRLEEMPAEEGFPPYLASRLASFYERAGFCEALSHNEGSVTIIGAVSPQGGDFSEPVTQNTKRFVRCFWTLDRALAYARHFPAIQWLTSYSEYLDDLTPWYDKNVGKDFIKYRAELLKILNEESALMEIVKLIGSDVLPDSQKLILEIARVIRLGYVQQNAYHDYDTYVPFEKQMRMMDVILYLYDKCKILVGRNIPMSTLKKSDIFERVISIKYNVSNQHIEKINGYKHEIDDFFREYSEM